MSAPDLAVEHLGADYFQDPYSVHARLRAQRPVTPVIMPGGAPVWLITGYAEARAALADPRLSTCSIATRRTTNGCASW